MSLEVRAWAARQTWGAPLERFVALVVADVLSPFNDCTVSLDYISEATELTEAQCQETLNSLNAKGLLRISLTEQEGKFLMVFPKCEALCNPEIALSERQEYRARLVRVFDRCCVHCKRQGDEDKGPDGRVWTIDRLVPGSKGGTYKQSNVALSCFTCNIKRGNRPCDESIESLKVKEAGQAPWRQRKRSLKKSKRRQIFKVTESAVTRIS